MIITLHSIGLIQSAISRPMELFKVKKILKEDDIILMINVAEHVKRPTDMLMFLGEYFKVVV